VRPIVEGVDVTTALGYAAIQDGGAPSAEDERRLRDRIAAFARAGDLTLVEVHVDADVRPGRAVRPGLEALFSSVRARAGAVVLVPTTAHLSPHEQVRAAIETNLRMLGCAVLAIRVGEGRAEDTGDGHPQ
jgi:hypothetical protein